MSTVQNSCVSRSDKGQQVLTRPLLGPAGGPTFAEPSSISCHCAEYPSPQMAGTRQDEDDVMLAVGDPKADTQMLRITARNDSDLMRNSMLDCYVFSYLTLDPTACFTRTKES